MIGKFVRLIIWVLAITVLVIGAAFIFALEAAPTVRTGTPPSPEDVRDARAFVHGVRAAVKSGSGAEPFVTTEGQLNSVIRLGARFLPEFRGQISTLEDSVEGIASIPVPLPFSEEPKWLNLRAIAPEFEGQFSLSKVQIGQFDFPPGLALGLARFGGNVVLGNDLGDRVLSAATSMQVENEDVVFELAIGEVGQNGIIRAGFGALRGAELPAREQVDFYYLAFRKALDAGTLPAEGSFLPHIVFMIEAASSESSGEDAPNTFSAAIFALARACGATNFAKIVGGYADVGTRDDHNWQKDCLSLTLNERIDSRLHFVTAAAIQAASNLGFAVSIGEFKELYDSASSSGFDFTDIAANNSGIRMSNTFMATSPEDWGELLALLEQEQDVIVSFEGLPKAMSREDFEATYGNVESAQYNAMIMNIEERIDQLPIHQEK